MLYKSLCMLQIRFFYKLTRLKMGLPNTSIKKEITTKPTFTYEDAIYTLNGLQSNSLVLEKARKERSANAYKHLTNTEKFLRRLHISLDDLDRLNVIHVSGTKGKGSTCAFAECLLRHQSLKTGFYSSPHLVAVRERIRINGQPLSKDAFAFYFWKVYNQLKECQVLGEETTMPPYFAFLTVMAFYVFLQEKVDVVVCEVGVGGLFDCTNVIRFPVAVGVTSLGFDHVSLLGNTIEEIAFQKSGIFKPGVPAFTVSQVPEAMKVFQTKAMEVNCPLYVVPPLVTYDWEEALVQLGVPGEVQSENASLALQLCQRWISQKMLGLKNLSTSSSIDTETGHYYLPPILASPFRISSKFNEGLRNCVWPGRCQIIHRGSVTYFLDGAHTAESMKNCVKWYSDSCKKELNNSEDIFRILLFNATNERKPETLLTFLVDQHFDLVMFSPNRIYTTKDSASDHSNFTVDPETELRKCKTNMKVWHHLVNSLYEEISASAANSSNTVSLPLTKNGEAQMMMFSCLQDALQWTVCDKQKTELNAFAIYGKFPEGFLKAKNISILVTGSLHLVGNVLSIIDPELQSVSRK